ncbi:MAG: RsmE family RNA methyltransferase [Acidimicrobiales bacterium]
MAGDQAGASPAPPASPGAAPDPVLLAAKAMVFVTDVTAPALDAGSARHLLGVLRLRPGELVVAADGLGTWVQCRMAAGTSSGDGRHRDLSAILVVDGPPREQAAIGPRVTVAFAPAKGDRPEWVVQKLTELGVDRIVPINANRSVVRWEGERAVRAVERLRRVAREAASQSRRTWLPEITPVSSLIALEGLTGGRPSLAHPGGSLPSLRHPVIAVGPEGGWDHDELAGEVATVGLGPTVLRAETAALAAGTLLCSLRAGRIAPIA